jgi:PAS domain-containing protein
VPELNVDKSRTQMERWKILVDNANMLVFGLDPHGRINFVNPHFLNSTGYTEEEIIGRRWWTSLGNRKRRTLAGRIQQCPEKRGPAGKNPAGVGHQKPVWRGMSTGRMCCCATLTERLPAP